jgi:spore maturation protein B
MAIIAAKVMSRFKIFNAPKPAAETPEVAPAKPVALDDTSAAESALTLRPPLVRGARLALVLAALFTVLLALAYALYELALGTPAALLGMKDALGAKPVEGLGLAEAVKTALASWPLPLLLGVCVFLGLLRGVKVYDCVVQGGKEAFNIALRIIPYLVAILVAVGMLRASGAIDLGVAALSPATDLIGMPAEVLPMALLRPLSGSGSLALAAELMKSHGPDSLIGNIAATMYGSSETTFYIVALYFGVVAVRRVRHTIWACLLADATGLFASVWIVRWLLS